MELDENKLRDVFASTLGIDPRQFGPQLKLGDVAEWDSVSHFDLVCAIEEAFQVRFSTQEIEELLSVQAIQKALRAK